MITKPDKNSTRKKRHTRVRAKLSGTATRPRLNAQVIDDTNSVTIASASTLDKGVEANGSNVESAKAVGELVAKRAIEKGIKSVVFDRGGYLYHGRVKALADAAREAGLEF
jgi:large subunit ribosomal protein L18